ncbi:MAG: hypothetical protein GDYSWBUE_000890 [Candidatus Fervidibacterota bacterium]
MSQQKLHLQRQGKTMKVLPKELHRYFWDTDPTKVNLRLHRQFIIERLLEFGDEEAIRWLRRTFGDDAIGEVVQKSRRLSKRTANFWRLILGIPKERVKCLSKRSQDPLKRFWND